MPLTISILSPGFVSPNSSTFLFPLVRHEGLIREAGLELRIFASSEVAALDADQIWVDSKCLSTIHRPSFRGVVDELPSLRTPDRRVLFFDTQDSTGSLEVDVLEHVDGYYKAQLLRDLGTYRNQQYGLRVHTHHCHERFGIEDSTPELSTPVPEGELRKLGVSWNSGLTDFALFAFIRRRWHQRIGLRALIDQPRRLGDPGGPRPIDVACRMSIDYGRETVAFQRRRVRQLVAGRCRARQKLPRALYLAEMRLSKVVLSPFGWGEVNYRDFECIRAGALLVKPDMSHLRTFPDWYEPDVTFLSHSWDLEDVQHRIGGVLALSERRLAMASEAQCRYRHFTLSDAGREAFVERVTMIADHAARGAVLSS